MSRTRRQSFFDASARNRIAGLFDEGSFREFVPPTLKQVSPHLAHFNIPCSFDDGAVVGEAALEGTHVLVFAQEGRFMGGALGEVHASKIVGLLRRACRDKPKAVVGLLDSGGVRLQEANVGEIGADEIIRAAFDARAAGTRIVGLIGGVCGCFGGMGIISCCLDALIATEHGRIGVSGPEVIETNVGVQEFDSRDKALVWRTTGAKNRYLFGIISRLVEDHVPDFRAALVDYLKSPAQPFTSDLPPLEAAVSALRQRLESFGSKRDACEIWKAQGIADPSQVPEMTPAELTAFRPSMGARQ
jgi:malonate decarboxylase beta subunit